MEDVDDVDRRFYSNSFLWIAIKLQQATSGYQYIFTFCIFYVIHIGDYVDSISWSNRMSTTSRHQTSTFFHIYDFSLCDVSLFGSFTSHYPASISPASRCLTVPMQIFDNIAGWLPLECPHRSTTGGQRLCYLGSVGANSIGDV